MSELVRACAVVAVLILGVGCPHVVLWHATKPRDVDSERSIRRSLRLFLLWSLYTVIVSLLPLWWLIAPLSNGGTFSLLTPLPLVFFSLLVPIVPAGLWLMFRAFALCSRKCDDATARGRIQLFGPLAGFAFIVVCWVLLFRV